jgi:hypothetical protein
MKLLKSLLLKAGGKISKEKVTALVIALLTTLQTLDIIHLTVEEMTTIGGVIASLWMLFSRNSREEATQKVVDAVQTSALDLGDKVQSADASAQRAAVEANRTAAAVTGSIAVVAAKIDRDAPQ